MGTNHIPSSQLENGYIEALISDNKYILKAENTKRRMLVDIKVKK